MNMASKTEFVVSLGVKTLALGIYMILPIFWPILQITMKNHKQMILDAYHMCDNLVVSK